jgi:NDP-sugar pyrophosphorylase family protein
MDVRAILLIGAEPSTSGAGSREKLAGIPFAYMDVLGTPVVTRVVQRLQRSGISRTVLLSDASVEAENFARHTGILPRISRIPSGNEELWKSAEDLFHNFADDGAELIVVIRLGGYVEIDYEELIQHHLDKRCAVTMAVDSESSRLDIFVLNASARKDANTLFRTQLQRLRRDCVPFPVTAYINRLQNAADFRRLGLDGLMGKNNVTPAAKETKPGVWAARSARIHPKARVVAPAYIGAHTKIRASALITRGTIVENHSEVDCGTVVENSTVLPYTCVGAGLDVMHSVVGFRRFAHLQRNVEFEITDKKLLGMAPLSTASRIAGSTVAAFSFLPKKIYRAVFARSRRKDAGQVPGTAEKTNAPSEDPVVEALRVDPESSEFPSNLAVARRYGNH